MHLHRIGHAKGVKASAILNSQADNHAKRRVGHPHLILFFCKCDAMHSESGGFEAVDLFPRFGFNDMHEL